ncbi:MULTISPECIES: c-type cytochrome biogenesis protein CcmI [unclassified Rhizobium]|uniref:c-type cytochrome biogenesis protein CcmI n=1 Tax=unclassified Rhizobium TaxID=2613769 RepID=UPI0007127A0F|nr:MULTISPECIES: c-type cytochrome biogenesis protein CcmI [unclassified Rhizobium]KQS96501.1 cytochrome C biogenesis protein CycH [Rhizobium sp. Leaf386]KQT06340.1 cytochrome C biogenesis protein CycH [Rhizobium sp. Leaf391]
MLFWILVAILTAAVAAVLLLPLLRAAARVEAPRSHDVEVYRDQLKELERDRAGGLISAEDAEFARAEVARRLLAASDAVKATASVPAPRRSNRLAQLAVVVILPAIGLCLYLRTGNPGVPDAPLAARLANPGNDMNILIARAERQLVINPEDGAGWDVLAPIYYRSGRVQEAATAFRNALRILGPTPVRLGGYAESLIALSGGLVTSEAQEALEKSLVIEPNDPRAQFYLALAMKQEGKSADALAAFRKIVATSPKDAPWLPLVNDHIASLDGGVQSGQSAEAGPKLGNPTADDIAAAQDMSAGDRTAMIEGMVGSLAEKLKADPKNFEGWMRIIRSYSVLGQKDKAAEALKQGLKVFPAEGNEGKQLLALAGELGLKTDGGAQ